MSTTEIAKPEELSREGSALVAAARALVIVDAASYAEAGERRKTVKLYLSRVNEWGRPIVAAADHAHKVALQQLRTLTVPAEEADAIYKARRLAYESEQERARLEAERVARVERERLEAEARAVAAAEQARLHAEEEERRLVAAVAAEAKGDVERAERILAEPVVVPTVVPAPVVEAPPVYIPPPPKVEGITARVEWDFEIIEPFAVPREYLMIDNTAIRAVVRALKDKTRIAGVRVFPRRNEAVRI